MKDKTLMPWPLPVGCRVQYDQKRKWWMVRASSTRYAVTVQQRPFQPAGVMQYSVIDWSQQVRGAINLIGQGYGDGSYTTAECEAMLVDLVGGDLEVSWRNRVALNITASDGLDLPLEHLA